MGLRRHQHPHLMTPGPVVNDLLSPRLVPVQRSEPYPLARGSRYKHVRERADAFAPQPPHVIDENCGVRVVIGRRKRQVPLFDFQHQEHRCVRSGAVIGDLVVLRQHQFLAVSDRPAKRALGVNPGSLGAVATTQRRAKRTRHVCHSIGSCGRLPWQSVPVASWPAGLCSSQQSLPATDPLRCTRRR